MGRGGVIAVNCRRKVKYPLFPGGGGGGLEAVVMLLLALWPKYLSCMLCPP